MGLRLMRRERVVGSSPSQSIDRNAGIDMNSEHTAPNAQDELALNVLMKMFEDNRVYQRYHETQRLNFGSLMVAFSAAILSVIVHFEFTEDTIALSFLLAGLGIFGFIASEKLYERTRFHRARTEELRKMIDSLVPYANILEINMRAEKNIIESTKF